MKHAVISIIALSLPEKVPRPNGDLAVGAGAAIGNRYGVVSPLPPDADHRRRSKRRSSLAASNTAARTNGNRK
jgi:hypothetical protein